MTVIYLDNNATTQVDSEVLEAMLPFYHELYGNPSSMHFFGGQVGRKVREAREQVAALLGAAPDEIIFTSCGTESDNTAIRSALATLPDKRHIVTTRVEHPAINALVARLAKEGYRVTELPVDGQGRLDLFQYDEALTSDTAIVSMMWANNETGVIFPVEKAAAMARDKGILFHTDAVQAVGKIPIDLWPERHRPAFPFRPQTACRQGRGRPLRPQRHQVRPLHSGRPPGERPPGRHRKRPQPHRPG